FTAEVGEDDGGGDGVDGHAPSGPFGGEHLGQADHAELGGAVGHVLVQGDRGGLRRQVDDLPAARGQHAPPDLLRHQEGALEVDVDGLVERADLDVLGRGQQRDAGAVDQDVD